MSFESGLFATAVTWRVRERDAGLEERPVTIENRLRLDLGVTQRVADH